MHIRNDHARNRHPAPQSSTAMTQTTYSSFPTFCSPEPEADSSILSNPASPILSSLTTSDCNCEDSICFETDHGDESEREESNGGYHIDEHPLLNGQPCDPNGNYLPDNVPPSPFLDPPTDDYSPYEKRTTFELADLLFRREQMSGGNIDDLLQILAADSDGDPPFANKEDLYQTIDSTKLGDVPWESFSLSYSGDLGSLPEPWMTDKFEVHYRNPDLIIQNQLGNRDFATEIDMAPKKKFDENGRVYENLMEGNWIWRQADKLSKDSNTHGCVPVPVICGSDKTTVSVATGQNEYYPLYISAGNIHNNVHRAHRDGLSLCAFLSIPKTDREHQDSAHFRRFRRQLFHASLREVFQPLHHAMTTPAVVRFGDGHYRRVVYLLGPYITDYPEQVQLACIVQNWCGRCTASSSNLDGPGDRRTHTLTSALMDALDSKQLWDNYGIVDGIMPFTHYFPNADIHELLAPDLLHQIIKGTFKDHLVTWVEEWIDQNHCKSEAKKIKAEIDRRIAAVPYFPNLRCFPQGRGFKQWTGDDSKALMKVYLPAISGIIPPQMVRAFAAFLNFCYLVRRNIINQDTLDAIDAAVTDFHRERIIFADVGVRNQETGFSLPRQHSLTHYRHLIEEFGAPNGLCSSITESKHIKAVKQPWRRSSRFEALGQMVTVNQRLDKLTAVRVNFCSRGMLAGPLSETADIIMGRLPPNDEEDDDGSDVEGRDIMGEVKLACCRIHGLPTEMEELAHHIDVPQLPFLIRWFLYQQDYPDADQNAPILPSQLPHYTGPVHVYPSAVATFYAPSDKSGIGGLMRERIRSVSSWRKGAARRDCVYVEGDPTQLGFRGLLVARVMLFFSIKRRKDLRRFPCALVTWFSAWGDEPCSDTRMWRVTPDVGRDGIRTLDVIHLDTILRGAHLIGNAGSTYLPRGFRATESLDAFTSYFVNNLADHHTHEIVF
ncbi:hypothetical protein D9758_012462 [Tetrapyrgos nigripes]|uniref:Uncharacterized protein n=1 Tax=Tetrapyrgos nigripes TaxID=182062 RepID=A0A8H5FVN1_9AGAR|nr:hypothetical protein D9758_012462 [Tetrapyrgos nigripes]